MQMTGRIGEILEANMVDHYIPFVVESHPEKIFPMYYAQIMKENVIVFPVTNATGIDAIVKTHSPAVAMVADREGGFESYLLKGKAKYVTDESDYDLISEMRNMAPGFPIHGAVVFEVTSAELAPPP